jgi:dipeptide/tripeptide permease
LAYTIPLFGGWLGDTKLGRYKGVVIGGLISGIAHILMTSSAIPSLLQADKAIAPFIISFFMLAFGAGMLHYIQERI